MITMQACRKKHIGIYLKNLCFWLMLLFVAGCQSPAHVNNPFYKNTFGLTDTLSPPAGLKFLDSVNNILFKSHPPGTDDRAQYFIRKAQFQRSISHRASLSILDSLALFLEQHPRLPKFNRYYVQMLTARAEAYTYTFRYDEALKELVEAKQIIDKRFSDDCIKSEMKMHIADMLTQQQKYRLAAENFTDLYRNSRECDSTSYDRFYYGYSGLSNAGYCYHEAGMYDSAQVYLKAALQHIDENRPRFPDKASYFDLCQGVVSRHLGYTKMTVKEFAEAERLMQLAIKLTAREYPGFSESSYIELSEIYINSGALEKAKPMLDHLDSITRPNGSKGSWPYQSTINKQKKNFYHKQGDYVKALYHDGLADAARDSIDQLLRKNRDRDLAAEFTANEQRMVNDQLKLQNQQTAAHLQLAILLVVIAVLLIALIWSNLRRARKNANTLKKFNEEIQLQKKDVVEAYTLLENSYNENQRLLRTVAHDLKNPLAAIRSLVGSFAKKIPNEEVKETVTLIEGACNNSIELINTMMLSETAKLTNVHKEVNDMWRLLQYCVDLMKPKAEEKNQHLLVEGEHLEAFINKDKMWRVITNIINNAIKFSPEKGTIHVRLERVETDIVLSVQDEGIGIPDHLQDKIFTAVPEIQREGTAGEKSYGLGLSISKKIVEEHEGKLWVESKEGNGSTFFVMLPSGN